MRLFFPKLIAQGAFTGGDLAQNSAENADAISQGFNELWAELLNGPLYGSLCTVGTLFAVSTLVFFMIEWTKQMLNFEETRAITDLIWPLTVAALLFQNGQLLGQGTMAIRDMINNTNRYVLIRTAAGVDLRAAYQKALGVEAVRSAIGREMEMCRTSSLAPQDAIDCLTEAKQRLMNEYPRYFVGSDGPFAWLIDRIDRIISAPIDAIKGGANPVQILLSPFSAYVGSVVAGTITNILVALGGAYQWGIELTMLLTALLGPLAVGGSLLPYGSKSIFTWLVGYFSVGMAKLSFNIITGFAAELMANSRSDQPLFFLFVIGIIAPALATGLAAGGGLALLTQLNNAADQAINVAKDVAVTVVSYGGGALAKVIRRGI
ncbi:hypothetical protein [aff. Roholtiella sp. LEGE 12411]|uniref:hypothetical protein n=1 Tax=aff. Roholtiella sp. LEGE 12411 TaxID=1828822 RepID=UPI0018818ABC|nr:hypothetical protein [aff. Roholtiella sp. LEGE 12411]MBE9036580.1 hypothetical protein [aff. Roholtiella sp. LEGE 12411]